MGPGVSVPVPAGLCVSPLCTRAHKQEWSHDMHVCLHCVHLYVLLGHMCVNEQMCVHTFPGSKWHLSYDGDPHVPQTSVLGEAEAWPLQGAPPAGGSPLKLCCF